MKIEKNNLNIFYKLKHIKIISKLSIMLKNFKIKNRFNKVKNTKVISDTKIRLKGIRIENRLHKIRALEIIDKLAIKLREIKIKNRLMISFAITLLISMLLMSLFSIKFAGGVIESKVSNFSAQEMNLISKNIQYCLDNTKSNILSVTLEKEFQDNLNKYNNMDEIAKSTFSDTLKDGILKEYMKDENVISVVVTDEFGKFVGGKGYNAAFADKAINLKDNKGGKIFLSIVDISENSSKHDYGINMFKEIKNTSTGDIIGYFWINYKEDVLYNIYQNNVKGDDSNLIIIDSNGTVVSSKNKNEINNVYKSKELINAVNSSKSAAMNIDNKGYFVSSSKVEGYDWNIVCMIANSYLNKEASIIKYYIAGIAILEFLVAILLSYIISISISKPLNKIMKSIEKAKEGKIKAEENDLNKDELSEVSRSFNDMVNNIGSLINNTKTTSSTISKTIESIAQVSEQSYAASEEIASSMNEVTAGAQSQAEGMAITSSYLNKLFDEIDKVEISLKDILGVSSATQVIGEETKAVIAFLKEKSEGTKGVSMKISYIISDLNNYMEQIKDITKLIVKISEQTNLLSLNASIESARAGDVGKGFTIVAEQVRKLAIQSKEASIKIEMIIGELTKKIMIITQSSSKTQSIINKQDEAIGETHSTELGIMDSMAKVDENITQLIGVVREIYNLKDGTLRTIEGISTVSEETAAITQEVTAVAQEQITDMENLSRDATSLNKMIQALDSTLSKFEV